MKRWAIAKILYVSFFLMIILPIFLVTLLAVQQMNGVLLDNMTARAEQSLEQVSYTVDTQATRMLNTVAAIATDPAILSTASAIRNSDSVQEQYAQSERLNSLLSNFFHYTSDITGGMVFFRDGGAYRYKQDISEEGVMRNSAWYAEMLATKDHKVRLFGLQEQLNAEPKGLPKVAIGIMPKYSNDVEMIYFTFQPGIFDKLLRSRVPESGPLYVVDENGKVISTSEEDSDAWTEGMGALPFARQAVNDDRGNYVTEVGGTESFVVYLTSERGWKYIQAIPYDRLSKQVNQTYHRIMLVSTIGLIIFLIVSYFLVRNISKPILALSREMNRIKTGNFRSRLKSSGPKEIYMLGSTFNEMVERMDDLIREREEKEAQKNRAELDALQSQINPHFLLNTLNAIKIMSVMAKAAHIERMTDSLTRLLSSAFNKGGAYNTIGDEMKLLSHYLNIMKIRYGDEFDIDISIEDEMQRLHVLKLLIQPIVENAILHGLHGRETRGCLLISGRILDEQTIAFEVKDDGAGMSEQDVSRLLGGIDRRKDSFSGIGLVNVKRRIELNYGPRFGLSIDSTPGTGTRVVLILPLLRTLPEPDEGGHHV